LTVKENKGIAYGVTVVPNKKPESPRDIEITPVSANARNLSMTGVEKEKSHSNSKKIEFKPSTADSEIYKPADKPDNLKQVVEIMAPAALVDKLVLELPDGKLNIGDYTFQKPVAAGIFSDIHEKISGLKENWDLAKNTVQSFWNGDKEEIASNSMKVAGNVIEKAGGKGTANIRSFDDIINGYVTNLTNKFFEIAERGVAGDRQGVNKILNDMQQDGKKLQNQSVEHAWKAMFNGLLNK
jgi:hypothetical protein